MRLNSYLIEGITAENAEDAAKNLERECAPIIKVYRKRHSESYRILYRAVSAKFTIYKKKSHLKDRKPMSTNIKLHDYLNDKFQKLFGWPGRNGVGATGSSGEAGIYGHPYVFFPKGKLNFIWSPEVYDLWGTITSRNIRDPNDLDEIIDTYQNTDIHSAIDSGKEIYFNCKEYYLVDGTNKFGFGGFEILQHLGLNS